MSEIMDYYIVRHFRAVWILFRCLKGCHEFDPDGRSWDVNHTEFHIRVIFFLKVGTTCNGCVSIIMPL